MNAEIDFHIFGGSEGERRYGESILVRSPNGRWGMVDSCIGSQYSPLLFLEQQHIEKDLDFILLTHPHRDHYIGFPQIFDFLESRKIRVREFFRYFGNPIMDKVPNNTRSEREAFLNEFAIELSSFEGYHFPEHGFKNTLRDDILEVLIRAPWEPIRCDDIVSSDDFGCLVQSISPSRKFCSRIYARMLSFFIQGNSWKFNEDEDSKVSVSKIVSRRTKTKIRRRINQLSVATRISLQNFEGLLLSDLEPKALNEVFKSKPSWFKNIRFVKVAHHGGFGADPEIRNVGSFFKALTENGKKKVVAVVTHYSKSHPKIEFLNSLKRYCSRIFLTSKPFLDSPGSADSQPRVLFSDSEKSRDIGKRVFARSMPFDSSVDLEGKVHLKFDIQGRLLSANINGGAMEFK